MKNRPRPIASDLMAAAEGLRLAALRARAEMNAAEEELNDFLFYAAQCPEMGIMKDVFGDGEAKKATECAMPGGKRPAFYSAMRKERPADGSPGVHEAASVEDRGQAQGLLVAFRNKQEAYKRAAIDLNQYVNQLMYKEPCPRPYCFDVFGDGEYKLMRNCHWPDGIVLYRSRSL